MASLPARGSGGSARLSAEGSTPYIWVADRSVNVGMTVDFYAIFRTMPDRTPQAGKTVTFKVDGTPVADVVTDSAGIARSTFDTAGLSVGSHTIRCEFAGDAEIGATSGEAPLMILPPPAVSAVWVAEASANIGMKANLYACLRTMPDRVPQPGKILTFKIDGTAIGDVVTDSGGVARYSFDALGIAVGTHTIRCEFAGDADVAASDGEAPLTILATRPYIWVANASVPAGYTANLYAYFRTLPDMTPQAGKSLTLKIDGTGVTTVVTDDQGKARPQHDTHGMTVGPHTIRFEFSGDSEIAEGYGEGTLTIEPAKPYIWVAPTSVNAGMTANLYAYFRTLPDMTPQPGKTVRFKVNGSLVRTVVTDENGVARCQFDTHGRTVGNHTITCEFAGDTEVAAGSGQAALTINVPQSYVWVADSSVNLGLAVTLRAGLRTLPDRTPQSGKSLTFKIDGTTIGSATTGADGTASVAYNTYGTGITVGAHTIRCEFAGDSQVAGSAGEGTLTVEGAKPYITVPDASAKAGASVQLHAIFLTHPDNVIAPGKTVKFKIDGKQVGITVTDAYGIARYTISTTGLSVGSHTITCLFLGDATVAPGAGEGVLTIN